MKIPEEYDHLRKFHPIVKDCSQCCGELTVFASDSPDTLHPERDEEFVLIVKKSLEGATPLGTAKFYECNNYDKIDLYRYPKYERTE
jgi:hypothetical protein